MSDSDHFLSLTKILKENEELRKENKKLKSDLKEKGYDIRSWQSSAEFERAHIKELEQTIEIYQKKETRKWDDENLENKIGSLNNVR